MKRIRLALRILWGKETQQVAGNQILPPGTTLVKVAELQQIQRFADMYAMAVGFIYGMDGQERFTAFLNKVDTLTPTEGGE